MAEVRSALQPVHRPAAVFKWASGAVAAAVIIAVAMTLYRQWLGQPPDRPQQPQTILVADFVNTTGDTVFDGVIDSALAVALESSTSINVYARRDATTAAAQIPAVRPLRRDGRASRGQARGSAAPGHRHNFSGIERL